MPEIDIEKLLKLSPKADSAAVPEIPDTVEVVLRDLGGVHVFTSLQVPGLHHAHRDLKIAYDTLPQVLSDLMRLQYGKIVEYSPDRSFEEMVAGKS